MDQLQLLATLTLTALMVRHGEAEKTENCTYLYTRQPGPTDRCCNLKGHSPLILQCQVSSKQEDFSIRWHYSLSLPDVKKTTSEYYINQNRPTYNVTQITESTNQSKLYVTSQLGILGFDNKEMGYYWCSVYRDSHEHTTPNPSSILFISSNLTTEELQSCMESVQLYRSVLRCADSAASNDVVNAQDTTAACGSGDEPTVKAVADTLKTTSADDKPKLMKTTAADTATATQSTTPGGSDTLSTTIDAGVIILLCATLSTAVLIMLFIIGLLMVVLLKKTSRTNNEGSCSSVVTTSQKAATTESRVTDIICEPNVAHEISISVTTDYLYIVPS